MLRAFGKKRDVVQLVFQRILVCTLQPLAAPWMIWHMLPAPIRFHNEEWQWLKTQFNEDDAQCWLQKEDNPSPEGRM